MKNSCIMSSVVCEEGFIRSEKKTLVISSGSLLISFGDCNIKLRTFSKKAECISLWEL